MAVRGVHRRFGDGDGATRANRRGGWAAGAGVDHLRRTCSARSCDRHSSCKGTLRVWRGRRLGRSGEQPRLGRWGWRRRGGQPGRLHRAAGERRRIQANLHREGSGRACNRSFVRGARTEAAARLSENKRRPSQAVKSPGRHIEGTASRIAPTRQQPGRSGPAVSVLTEGSRGRVRRRTPPRMINDIYSSLTSREQRALRWSAAAPAVALWLATAWADPWILLLVPLVGAAYVAYAAHSRRRRSAMTLSRAPTARERRAQVRSGRVRHGLTSQHTAISVVRDYIRDTPRKSTPSRATKSPG